MTVHTRVTTIGHSAAGMGQVWYRVTGSTSIRNSQVAYRVGTQDPAVRRVRFVGAGGTARLLEFTPGELVSTETHVEAIARAFSGEHLTHGVKTQRSRLARVPAPPVHAVVSAALARASLEPSAVFVSRDAQNWWRSLTNAAARDRSVSFLTAAGVLRAAARAGADVNDSDLHGALGEHWRDAVAAPVDVRRLGKQRGAQTEGDALDMAALDDVTLGAGLWSQASRAADRRVAVGNAGYELTLTLPKSFSLYAVSGDRALRDQWLDVMEAAATRALARLMAEAGFCSTGHRGDGEDVRILEADGWAGFIATEISSRAGDPHLHVHCTLPNVLLGRDGVTRTMADGGRELIINARRFAAWGQAYVIEEAMSRGLMGKPWFNLGTGQWEIGAFASDTIDRFSRGRDAVRDEELAGADGVARDSRGRARVTRAARRLAIVAKTDDQPTWDQLRHSAVRRAFAFGINLAEEREGTVTGGLTDPGIWSDEMWISYVARATCEHDSTTSLAHVKSVIDLTGCLLSESARARVTSLVLEEGFTRGHESRDLGMKTGGQRWVSTAALRAEERLKESFIEGLSFIREPGRSRATSEAIRGFGASNGWGLNSEQSAAVAWIADGHDAITLISGVGGSGKTSVLAAAHRALAAQGRTMLVTSTATVAASAAGGASGAPWMNLTALRHAIDDKREIRADVVVIDEASMADVESVAHLARWCARTDRRLVLQGDHRQLRAVGAGDAYNILCAEHPDRVVRLTANRRQRTEQGRAVADALHSRDIGTAWQLIKDGESVLITHNREHKLTVLATTVADRITEHGAGQVTCDAVTNAEVDDLNHRIHDRLIEIGTVELASVVTYRSGSRERRIGPGTLLRVGRPTGAPAQAGSRLVRGERATVVEATRDRVTVAFGDGRTRSLSPRTVLAHFDYGYAGTTHKVQGQTSAVHIASLGPAKDLASMYVSASRARDETLFVLDARDYLTEAELCAMQTWDAGQFDDEVLERAQAALSRRVDRVDSPRESMRPQHSPAAYSLPAQAPSLAPGGMSL